MRPDRPGLFPCFVIAPVRHERRIERVAIPGLGVVSAEEMPERADRVDRLDGKVVRAHRHRPVGVENLLQHLAIHDEFLKAG